MKILLIDDDEGKKGARLPGDGVLPHEEGL